MKKLSVITICYNEPNLEKTCESIINQTWQDFEWIVVDGGSNETIQKIWDKYKYRIDTFISEPDDGIYNAYNKGIKLASGEYINLMNAGDYFYDNNVLDNIFGRNQNHDEDFLYGDTYMSDNNDLYNSYTLQYPEIKDKNYFLYNFVNTQSAFMKKSLFEKFGYYDENYKIIADWEKCINFASNGICFKKLNLIVANFNVCGVSFSKETQPKVFEEFCKIVKKYFTEKEIDKEMYKHFSILERIFSIKNEMTKTYKVITILGIHIKIKRSKKA
ncbi:glycosyltransferase [bacterium]|nr:glycosyltransferase [bacterium]